MPFQKLQQLLQGNQMPSPTRSAMVQQLLQQSQQMPPGALSPISGINRAAKPILAALLARQEERARETQSAREQVALQQMMSALQRGDTEMASGVAGGLPNNPMAQLLMQNEIQRHYQDRVSPEISAARQRVVPGQFTASGKPEEMDVYTEESPDGTVRDFYVNSEGRKTYVSGLTTPPERIEQGRPGEFSASDRSELNAAEIAARNFIGTVEDTLQLLKESPDSNTLIARAGAIVNDIQQNIGAAARNLGIEFEEASFDPENYAATFDQLGIENRQMRSLITTLAFQRAAASKQSGQTLSNRDVERFLAEIGADSADPRAFSRVLVDVARRSERMYQNTYQVMTGQSGDDISLGTRNLDQYVAPEGPLTGQSPDDFARRVRDMSDEELRNLARELGVGN